MALFNCPECNKEISDKAVSCPGCGYPINISELEELFCPEFPKDLTIGEQITNWGGDAEFSGEFRPEDNVVRLITPGNVKVLLYKSGIKIVAGFFTSEMDLHNSQIISTEFADTSHLISQNKSIIGRAVVGGLLMGPMASIIGGMSGIGAENKMINSGYLVINYWDRFTKQAQTILIRGNEPDVIRAFVGRLNTEKSKVQTLAQIRAIEKLNPIEKRTLEICKEEGLTKATVYYASENNIDFENNSDAQNAARKYVEDLSKSFSVQPKEEGCFIATACYGDYNSLEVLVLRQFRDNKLMTNSLGKFTVATYYAISPFLAKGISKSNRLKKIIRKILLQPIVQYLQRNSK